MGLNSIQFKFKMLNILNLDIKPRAELELFKSLYLSLCLVRRFILNILFKLKLLISLLNFKLNHILNSTKRKLNVNQLWNASLNCYQVKCNFARFKLQFITRFRLNCFKNLSNLDKNLFLIFFQLVFSSIINGNPYDKDWSHDEHLPARPSIQWANPSFRPYFDSIDNQVNITAQLGKSTFLICKIRQITDESVSWVRQRDLSIISAGEYIFSSDTRFRAKHVENSEKWALHIDDVQKEDEGVYECQVSSEPRISLSFYLNVIEASTIIEGKKIIYHKKGDTLNLTCVVNQTASPPLFIYWQHENRVLNYLNLSPYKLRITNNLGTNNNANNNEQMNFISNQNYETQFNKKLVFYSNLIIYDLDASDAGNYSCKPIPQYADAANITLNVQNGDNPAAMQHSNQLRNKLNWISLSLIHIFLICKLHIYD